jgi:hypothetical protein
LSDLVIVSLVVEDSALNLIRFPLFVSSGTRVWEKFWEMIGEILEETLGVTTKEMIRSVSNDATNAVSEN